MASNEKNFKVKLGVTTPKVDYTLDDKVITAEMLDLTTPTLSYSGSAGQLFSISDDLTGTIFSVNDISGIPSLEVNADGTVSIAEFDGNVGIGTSSPTQKLDVAGAIRTNDGLYSSTDLILGSNDTAVAYVKTSGEVGIGVDTPTNTLDVNGTFRARTVNNATGDFATVSATGVLQKRTAAETLSDIGASASSHTHPISEITNLQTSLDGKANLSGATFTGNVNLIPTGGSGSLKIEGSTGNPNIELGLVNGTASTPFIDFHSGTSLTDFDARILASGGSGTLGQGTLQLIAGDITLSTQGTGSTSAVRADRSITINGTTQNLQANRTWTLTAGDVGAAASSHTHPVSEVSDSTTLGQNLVKFANPGAIRFIRINADNTVTARTAADFRGDIGAGTSSTVGTVTSVGGTGTVAGITLSGTVTSSGNLTLGGTLSTPVSTINDSTTVGQNLVKLTNPSAIRFIRINADNSVSALDAATFRSAIGAGTSSTTGTVTSVAAGNGLDFTTITGSGSVTLGTPGTITGATTNSVTATSHTHALTLAAATFNNGGAGAASGTTFDGTTARTISYNTVGAAASSHTHTTTDITNLSSYTGLDSRYYTETEVDNFAVKLTGDQTIDGAKTFRNSLLVDANDGGTAFRSIRVQREGTDTSIYQLGFELLDNGVGNLKRLKDGVADSTIAFRDTDVRVVNAKLAVGGIVPSEQLDIDGRIRARTIDNATGDFVTASATGVLQKRTASEVKTDLSINNVENTALSTYTGFDSRYYTETEVDGFAVKLTGDQTITGEKTFSNTGSSTAGFESVIIKDPSGDSANIGFHDSSNNQTFFAGTVNNVGRIAAYDVGSTLGRLFILAEEDMRLYGSRFQFYTNNPTSPVERLRVKDTFPYVELFNGTSWENWVSVNNSQTFLAAQTVRASASQDGVTISGRAGGTNGYAVTITPGSLTGPQTLTLPNDSGTVALSTSANIFTVGQLIQSTTAGALIGLNGGLTVRKNAAGDAINIQGNDVASNGSTVFLVPATLTADRTLTLPDATGTFARLEDLGATGGGSDQIFWENDVAITTDYTITTNKNAMTAGPVTVANGVTVTVPSGSTWTVV
jgi:hypothetical protein